MRRGEPGVTLRFALTFGLATGRPGLRSPFSLELTHESLFSENMVAHHLRSERHK